LIVVNCETQFEAAIQPLFTLSLASGARLIYVKGKSLAEHLFVRPRTMGERKRR